MTAASAPALWPPTGVEVAFLLVGLVAFGSAVLVVTSRQIVHAALWLVVTLGALAACYLLLTAEFVAWVQVLLYVGAVVMLLLFGLMLTRAPIGRSTGLDTGNRPAAVVVAVGAAGLLLTTLGQAFGDAWIDLDAVQIGNGTVIGTAVFRHWVLAFEVLSVLLLAALVGAIVISKRVGRP